MRDLLPLLFLLVCPLAMMLMMRGMHSAGHKPDRRPDGAAGDARQPDPRIAALEAEVTRLRAERDAQPDAATADGRRVPGGSGSAV